MFLEIFLALGMAAGAHVPKPLPFRVMEPAEVASPYRREGRAIVFEAEGIRISMEEVLPAEDEAFFRRCAGSVPPLPARSADSPSMRLFALTIRNGSKKDIGFQPGFVSMETEKVSALKTWEYSDLMEAIPPGADAETRRRAIERCFWNHPETVRPDGVATRLLAFSEPPARSRRAVIDCSWIYWGTESFHAVFPYRILPPPKAPKKSR